MAPRLNMLVPTAVRNVIGRTRVQLQLLQASRSTSEEYWTRHHVDSPDNGFATPEASLKHYRWRVTQNPGQYELMPVDRAAGLIVVDYGCGQGNDIVGFGTQSRPARLIGMDVSPTALAKAQARAKLHGIDAEFVRVSESHARLPLPDASVDLVHSSGVIHHATRPLEILRELRRVTKPMGRAQIMVYNRDSIWMHLYVAFDYTLERGMAANLSKERAFQQTTDGAACPIATCYRATDFCALARQAGWRQCEHTGNAISWHELRLLPKRFDALEDKRLDEESREFLYDLTFDARGFPLKHGQVAGLYSCFSLTA
jgi:ubiquinone/menaquinone biosynthesis C-methylase UbiE